MRRFLCVVVLSISAAACGKGDKPPAPSSGAPNAPAETGPRGGGAGPAPTAAVLSPTEEAKKIFATVCAACHGPSGAGDGPASESLTPRPRNYTDAAWQASVTDDDIKKIILEGGQAVGKSPAMPAQQQLKNQPVVVDELVKLIRSFGKK